jgi:cold-inducible RNA-binding protein
MVWLHPGSCPRADGTVRNLTGCRNYPFRLGPVYDMLKLYLTVPPIAHAPTSPGKIAPPLFDLARLLLCKIQKEVKLKNIFVGNLSFGTTESSVRALFEPYGSVDRVNIVTDRDTGQARGFAFVEMSVDAEGNAAISGLNGRDLDGRTLNVNEARPKAERGSAGGGYRGGSRQSRW